MNPCRWRLPPASTRSPATHRGADMKIARNPAEAGSIVDFVPFFKAFCNPTRAQIIEFLLGGERCVCEMTGPLDQSPVSYTHLRAHETRHDLVCRLLLEQKKWK